VDIINKEIFATRFGCAEMLNMSYSNIRRLYNEASKEKLIEKGVVKNQACGYKEAYLIPLTKIREWLVRYKKFGLVEQLDDLQVHQIADEILISAIE
jgi:hypothetical protein